MKEGLTAPPFSGVFEEGGFGGEEYQGRNSRYTVDMLCQILYDKTQDVGKQS
jgi:hypothetical protein